MLLLGSKSITVDGVQVFSDHSDPNQFWYLPAPVALARDPQTHDADFTFLKFRPAAVANGAKGGGFLMFTVDLQPDSHLEDRILAKVAALAPGEPKLSAVQFDEGSVACIAMNLQGGGGAVAANTPGQFVAVESILGACAPALFGDNAAAFSLTLSQEGATLLEEAFTDGMAPIGVIYNLKFTGMRPALDVKITADYKRIFNQFSAGLSAGVYFVSAGLEAGFEKLRQDGAIKIEVTNYTGAAELDTKEQWAMDFFKQTLISQWFEPTLMPGQLEGGGALGAAGLDAAVRGNSVRPPATVAPAVPPVAASPAINPIKPQTPSPTAGSGQPATPMPVAPVHPAIPSPIGAPTPAAPPPVPAPLAPPGHPSLPAALTKSPTANTGAPVQPAGRPPAAGSGLGFNPASTANALAPLANMGASKALPQVSFKLKYINQDELKTLTLEYHRSEATQRIYAPQGFFGLLAGDLDTTKGGRHFREVDLDDPFFRVFTVTVQAPIDYAAIGLTSAHVTLDYGDPQGDPQHLKHQDYLFDAEHHQDQQWQVFLDGKLDTAYRYSIEYHFDPQSPWKAQQYSYRSATKQTENRTLFINPFDDFAFLDVTIAADGIDTDIVTATDVHLSYNGPAGYSRADVVTVIAGKEPQHWKLRLQSDPAPQYTYHCVHHLSDGTAITTDPVTTSATTVAVTNPFAGSLDLTFVPLFDPAQVRFAFCDFDYSDADNHYHRQFRLQFGADANVPVSKHISIRDPKKIGFRYRLTFEGAHGDEERGAFIDTEDTLIAVKKGA
ncbi:hypothetical protein ACGFK1_31665 [Mycobacterium sp. NPDC048908]|uniref:hypothetical protein n=1 Tax=Mycobacterium sp. NPDC048908 TaxID=3364292 RepID=UPI0037137BC7